MKFSFYIVLGLITLAFAFWFVVLSGKTLPLSTPLMLVVILVFVVSPLGSWWMLYTAVRHERQPVPLVFLAFLPFASIWYYFERVRKGKHLTR